MRNLSSSELTQISGGRRARSTMLDSALRSNSPQYGGDEQFWLWSGSDFTNAWALSVSQYTQYVPNTTSSYGVFTESNGNYGVYSQSSGLLGALTYNPTGNYWGATVVDTIGNTQVGATVYSNHSVGFTVKVNFH
jgi:hypothetical protein